MLSTSKKPTKPTWRVWVLNGRLKLDPYPYPSNPYPHTHVGLRTRDVHYVLEHIGNGTGRPRGVGKLTRTLTREDRVLDLTGWPEKKSSKTVKKWLRYVQNTSFDDFTVVLIITQSILNRFAWLQA